MSKLVYVAAACGIAATTAFAAQAAVTPLNMKPGYWQETITSTVNGRGTPKTRTLKFCMQNKDLSSNRFGMREPSPGMKCQDQVIRSTPTDLDIKSTCTDGTSGSDIHMTSHALDPEHVTSHNEMTMTLNGRTMQSSAQMEGTWLGATCPAGRN